MNGDTQKLLMEDNNQTIKEKACYWTRDAKKS